jgi:glycosyltransferase involved in cell wall biosynthesis
MPETSVIIRAYNEATYIGEVLSALEEQSYSDFEIILIDSGSTDGTLQIADSYVDRVVHVPPDEFSFGHACNVGCEKSKGEYCAFISAHAIPADEYWLEPLVKHIRDPNVAMCYGKQVGTGPTPFSEARLLQRLFPANSRKQEPPDYWANNASSVIKKSLWRQRGFDGELTGHEDVDWAKYFMEQGYAVMYESSSCIHHIHDEDWDQIFNRYEREAIADVKIGVRSMRGRWVEYKSIPTDIFSDILAGIRLGDFNRRMLDEIIRYRYNQHMGTASGLMKQREVPEVREKYYYKN